MSRKGRQDLEARVALLEKQVNPMSRLEECLHFLGGFLTFLGAILALAYYYHKDKVDLSEGAAWCVVVGSSIILNNLPKIVKFIKYCCS